MLNISRWKTSGKANDSCFLYSELISSVELLRRPGGKFGPQLSTKASVADGGKAQTDDQNLSRAADVLGETLVVNIVLSMKALTLILLLLFVLGTKAKCVSPISSVDATVGLEVLVSLFRLTGVIYAHGSRFNSNS